MVEDIRAGNYVQVAVERAGIGTTTYYVWLKKAEQGLEPYREFRDAIRLAECEAEARIVSQISAAVPTYCRAAKAIPGGEFRPS